MRKPRKTVSPEIFQTPTYSDLKKRLGIVSASDVKFPELSPSLTCTIEMANGATLTIPVDGNLNLEGASVDGLRIEGELSKKTAEDLFCLTTELKINWTEK